jgi:hypothetical protein
MNFGSESNETAAGTWISPLNMTDMVGSTNFAGQTQDAAVHATINQQVLQIVVQFTLQFRQPIPDLGLQSSHKYVLQDRGRSREPAPVLSKAPLRTGYMVIPEPIDEKEEKVARVVERKEQPRTRSVPSAVRKGVG